ncbi:MAG: efflux transporter outer membrane subunit [Burkholderiales bacterium]
MRKLIPVNRRKTPALSLRANAKQPRRFVNIGIASSGEALLAKTSIALLALTLAACAAVGPDYERRDPSLAGAFDEMNGEVYTDAEPVAEFWSSFDDPQLTRLVEGALAANHDLRVALARLNQARALAGLQRFDRYPTVTAGAAATENRISEDQGFGAVGGDRNFRLYDLGADAFWELDFFGRVRRSIEAAEAVVDASAADLRAAQVSIAAEVARMYFELRGQQEQLDVARRNADNQRETLRLTLARSDAGAGTDFDVARSRGLLEATLSRIPALEAGVRTAMHRLAVLNGREPAQLKAELDSEQPLPKLPDAVAVGAPSELVRRRPDVQAAERRLAAATARIGVATADLFPRVTLNGTLGLTSASLGDLFSSGAVNYGFGPAIGWAFLDLGRVRARIAASDADAEANLGLYEGTVLRALEEAENSLVGYTRAQRERDRLFESAQANADAADFARRRFEGGISDFLQVLDAERTLLESQDSFVRSRTRTATALVAVYKALAGGWPERVPAKLSSSVVPAKAGIDRRR